MINEPNRIDIGGLIYVEVYSITTDQEAAFLYQIHLLGLVAIPFITLTFDTITRVFNYYFKYASVIFDASLVYTSISFIDHAS